jgi:hypothetical protein
MAAILVSNDFAVTDLPVPKEPMIIPLGAMSFSKSIETGSFKNSAHPKKTPSDM